MRTRLKRSQVIGLAISIAAACSTVNGSDSFTTATGARPTAQPLDTQAVVTSAAPSSSLQAASASTVSRVPTSSSSSVPPKTTSTTTTQPAASTTQSPSTSLADLTPTTALAKTSPSPIRLEPEERLRIVLTGDSITDQISPYLKWILGRIAEVERRHHGGTALCDWFADRGDELGFENLEDWSPHVYVVDHGGNALTPCMADADGNPLSGDDYQKKYLADSERLVEVAARTGSRVLFVDQPVGRGDLLSGTHHVFRTMPERYPGGKVRFLSTWAAVSPGGRFLQSAPCDEIEPGCIDGMGELRSPWPNGHLEALGAWRYAKAIVEEFVAAGWVDAEIVDLSNRVMP